MKMSVFTHTGTAMVLAATMLFAIPLRAQDATPTDTGQESSAMSQSNAPDIMTETFQSWVVRCATAANGGKLCEMTQELNDAKTGQRVLAIGIQANNAEPGSGRATIVAPLGLKLAPGIQLLVDEAEPVALPFDRCVPAGCIVRAELGGDQITALSNATTIGVDMVAPDDRTLGVKLSPEGFANAWQRLQELSQQ